MRIDANRIRNGSMIEYNDTILLVIEFKMNQDSITVKAKDFLKKEIVRHEFSLSDSFELVRFEQKEVEYSYEEEGVYSFLDTQTYDLFTLTKEQLPDTFKYIREGDACKLRFYKGRVMDVEGPTFVELKVTGFASSVKGLKAGEKMAILETGAEIIVPSKVCVNEIIYIDTRTDQYLYTL